MEVTINTLHEDMVRLQKKLELIEKVLLYEGKLTPWAKKALAKARTEKEESYTSLNEL